jgi:hypothetical protein
VRVEITSLVNGVKIWLVIVRCGAIELSCCVSVGAHVKSAVTIGGKHDWVVL